MAETQVTHNEMKHTSEVFFDTGTDLGKSTRAWDTVMTFNVTPTITGTMVVVYDCQFGFDTSAQTSSFRIKVDGSIIGNSSQPWHAVAARWEGVSMKYSTSVTAGTTYAITIEANHTTSYVQRQTIMAIVSK